MYKIILKNFRLKNICWRCVVFKILQNITCHKKLNLKNPGVKKSTKNLVLVRIAPYHNYSTYNSAFGPLLIKASNVFRLALEDTWDLRYPLCTGAQCPDSCDAGTTADLLLDCYMAIDLRKYTEKGHAKDGRTPNLHSEISLAKDRVR